jgi:hypothetical protein
MIIDNDKNERLHGTGPVYLEDIGMTRMPGGTLVHQSAPDQYQVLFKLMTRNHIAIMNFTSLLMIDFDTPSDRHSFEYSIVGETLEDLKRNLITNDHVFVKYGYPDRATWRIHQTAGGFHAFRMDVTISPEDPVVPDMLTELVCDPGYVALIKNVKTWSIRVSKKNDKEDQVYRVIETAFGGDGIICDECAIQIALYEELVRRHA